MSINIPVSRFQSSMVSSKRIISSQHTIQESRRRKISQILMKTPKILNKLSSDNQNLNSTDSFYCNCNLFYKINSRIVYCEIKTLEINQVVWILSQLWRLPQSWTGSKMMGCQVNSYSVKIALKNSASFFSERPTATVTTRTSRSATYYLEHSAKRQIRLIIFWLQNRVCKSIE